MAPGYIFARHLSSSRGHSLLRNAQRTTGALSATGSNVVSYPTSTVFTTRAAFPNISPLSSSLRHFSSDSGGLLLKTIQNEIEHETANFEEDKEAKSFLSKGNWTLKDSENDMMVTLTKNEKGKEVTVEFSCIQTGEALGEDGAAGSGGEMSDFTVSVQNPDGSGISFFCSTTQEEEEKFRFCIGQIRIYDNVKDKENISIYPGPYFEDLDDAFQQSLDEWLANLGIDSELCDFIDRFAGEKEQKEYVQWLKKFQKFVQ